MEPVQVPATAGSPHHDQPHAARRQLIEPWLNALQEASLSVELPALPTVSDMHKLWLQVSAPEGSRNDPDVWTLFMEAMEIMDLLARVDQKAAWQLLMELAEYEEMVAQYETLLWSLIRLLLEHKQYPSATYAAVKQSLLAEWSGAHDGKLFDREIHGRVKLTLDVEVTINLEDRVPVGVVLSRMKDLANGNDDPSMITSRPPSQANNNNNEDAVAQNQRPTSRRGKAKKAGVAPESAARAPQPRGAFIFDSFRLDLNSSSDVPLPNLAIHYLNEVGWFMRFSQLKIGTFIHHEFDLRRIGSFLLNQFVPWKGKRDGFGIEHLIFASGQFDAAGVRAICTSIAHSHSLKALTVESLDSSQPNHAARNVWWPWLAYALFSGEANHSIRSASLDVEGLQFSHVYQIRAVLGHKDPLAFLYQVAAASNDDDDDNATPVIVRSSAMEVTVAPSAQLRLGHYRVVPRSEHNQVQVLSIEEPGVWLQVIRNRENEHFIEFLLPGSGVCWTEKSGMRQLRPIGQRDGHSIRHLTLDGLSTASALPVIAFLRLVGGPIERLTLQESDDSLDGSSLAAIVASCPKLQRLDLSFLTVNSLDWLANWSIAKPLQVHTLCLDNVGLVDGLQWTSFFEGLADSSRPLSKSLRCVHVNVDALDSAEKQPAIMEPCLSMLAANVRLQRFELLDPNDELKAEYKQRLLSHHNRPIAEEQAPLPSRDKLALLSVFSPTEDSEQSEKPADPVMRHKLDPDVLRTIMAFAATPKRRVCGVY